MCREKIEKSKNLLVEICKIGRKHRTGPLSKQINPFEHYFNDNGELKLKELDKIDGPWTRREILSRYLLVSAVLDQGPDIKGVRRLVKEVVNAIYKKEIRIFHKPLDFFKELGISIDEILEKHESIKRIRANDWAEENQSNPNKYNLFMDGTNQVLGYAVYRWGVPLCVPLFLEKDLLKENRESTEPFVEYIENWGSAEIMSQQMKDNERYGLGKAIGDKAGHLFAKWYIHTFEIAKKKDNSFGPLSYELPFDSNAGRLLFRTGFLLNCAKLSDYEEWGVIQKGKGKGGTNYIRVTNIRGKKSNELSRSEELLESYESICVEYLKVKKRRPSKIEIQRIPNALLLGTKYGIGDLDDGLIYIGTNYCYNHDKPNCKKCPIKDLCLGFKEKKDLISEYRT